MKPFFFHKWRQGDHWGLWFEFLGYGLAVSSMDLFSQRMGITRCWRIGRIKISPIWRAPR